MACYHPIPALQDRPGSSLVLNPPLGTANLELPCGNCLGCFTARALEWANRCSHEASLWSFNSFLTLTYDEAHLPFMGGLEPDELCKFFKRLRKFASYDNCMINRDSRSGIRYFAAGEYGERYLRPHYHVLLFNCGFSDASFVGVSNSFELYESPTLSKLWRFGSHKLGLMTGASANYVAQYSMKKFKQDYGILPKPFIRMSLKPAIGAGWVRKYSSDLTHGYMVMNGHKLKIPRSYYRHLDPAFAEHVKYQASRARCVLREDNTPARRIDAEIIHEVKHRAASVGRRSF